MLEDTETSASILKGSLERYRRECEAVHVHGKLTLYRGGKTERTMEDAIFKTQKSDPYSQL